MSSRVALAEIYLTAGDNALAVNAVDSAVRAGERSGARAWLAAAAAWIMTQTLPLAIKLLDDYRIRYRRSVLVARREALADEWGLEDDSLEAHIGRV